MTRLPRHWWPLPTLATRRAQRTYDAVYGCGEWATLNTFEQDAWETGLVEILSDLNQRDALATWMGWLAHEVGLDPTFGTTWRYSPAENPYQVAAYVLTDAAGKEFWVTDWLPEFTASGLVRPTLVGDGRIALDNLPADPTEALYATLLAVAPP